MRTSSLSVPENYSISDRLSQNDLKDFAETVNSAPFVAEVLNAMPEMVAILTKSRQMLTANQTMLDLMGMDSRDFVPGDRPGEFMHCIFSKVSKHGCGSSEYCTQCGAFLTMLQSLSTNQKTHGECRLTVDMNGSKESIDLHLWCAPFSVNGEEFRIIAGVDISHHKRREALEKIFFHDVLNTMQTVKGYVELLAPSQFDDYPDIRSALKDASDYLLEEILTQRDLIKAENNELTPTPSTVVTTRILKAVKDLYNNQNLRSVVKVAEDSTTRSFISDITLLRRVLANMVKNALEAVKPDAIVTVGSKMQGDDVLFWVHNPGVMPKGVKEQIFQRSFSTKAEGRGLGTYSMRLLTERYLEGSISFSTREDQGTTFFVQLPTRPVFASKSSDLDQELFS